MSAKLNKLIEQRYSPRAFSTQKVEADKITMLIEAARWAASSRNEQPARYIIGEKGSESYTKIFSTLSESNQVWNAPVPLLILTLVRKDSSDSGKTNFYAHHDLGLAIGNLSLQATAMNLYVHQMGGFDKSLAIELFHIPDEFIPMTVLSIGYLGNIKDLPLKFQQREQITRTRKQTDKIVYEGDWEKLK